MQAIIQTGPRSVELQDRPEPAPNADEALIEVVAAGLCGSDAHAYADSEGYEWTPTPRIIGHEYAGRVVKVGDGVDQVSPGDGVVEEPVYACGRCYQCRNGQSNVCKNFEIIGMHTDGAYAEFRTADPDHLHHVPDGVPLETAAIAEPISVAMRTVVTRSSTTPGDQVLVEGPGPIGTFTAVVADAIGADVLVTGLSADVHSRFPPLEQLGIDTLNVETDDAEERLASRPKADGFDVVFDATGHHTGIETAVTHVRKGGEIVVVGLPGAPSELFLTDLVRGEVDLRTSYGSSWANFEQALHALEDDINVAPLIDESYDLDDAASAFEDFLDSSVCKPVFRFA